MGIPKQQQHPISTNDAIIAHMYVVEQETKKIIRRGVTHYEYDELYQLGMVGLIEAAHRFDNRHQCSFSVYARIRVQGSIIDAMRKKDWVPRSVRKRAKTYNEAIVYLTQKYERPPTKEELCIYIDIPVQKLETYTKLCTITPLISMEDRGDQALPICEKTGCAQESIIKKEEFSMLHACIKALPEQERELIHMYYFEEKNMKQIAACFSVSESRICQMHGRIKTKLFQLFKREQS